MARAIWKGTLGFGLVQIPVGLYSAEEANELSFTMLDRRDLSPIGYERINKSTGKKVDWDDVVKGYAYSDDEYVVLTDEDFAAANVEATQSVDISDFVEEDSVDPVYFERPYYLAPTKAGRKAYALLRETLKRSKKIGIAKVVIRTRQHLAAVMPRDGALTLMLLRFPEELRSMKDLDIPEESLKKLGVGEKELKMAEQLVKGMTGEFEPTKYHDEYRDDLLKLIEEKAEAGKINTVEGAGRKVPTKRPGAQVIDLMDLLKKSIGERGNGKRPARHDGRNGARPKGGPRKARSRSQRPPARKSA